MGRSKNRALQYEEGDEDELLDNEVEIDVVDTAPPKSQEELLRQRILNTLEIYPRVSPSMLQAALGPHNSPRTWRPILENLIIDGIVQRTQETHLSERQRYRTIIVISLSGVPTESPARSVLLSPLIRNEYEEDSYMP